MEGLLVSPKYERFEQAPGLELASIGEGIRWSLRSSTVVF